MNQLEQWQLLPQELRDRRQWLLAAPNDVGELKVPRSIDNGGNLCAGSHSDPSTWLDFDYAVECALERGYGVGYCCHEDDPYACVDLDVKNASNRPNNQEQWTSAEDLERLTAIRRNLDSYTELSQSGQGWHVWIRGKIGKGRKRDGVELYSQQRFIVCTGRHMPETPATIEDRQAMLNNMAAQMPTPDDDGPMADPEQAHDDDAVVERARRADPERFDAMCRGDFGAVGKPSPSEVDAMLVEALMYAGATNDQAERLWVATELGQRRKDGRVKTDRQDYVRNTLRFARAESTKRREAEAAATAHGAAVAAGLASVRQGPQRAAGAPQPAGALPWPGAGHTAAPAQQPSGAELLAKHRVDLSATAKAVHYLWGLYLLEGECTFLGGHGGKGKSMLSLQLACHLAAGVPFLNKPVAREYRVLFYSAEDPGHRLLRRVHAICAQANLDVDKVLTNLCVIDATDFDPLFGEVQDVTNVADLDDKKPFYLIKRQHAGTADYRRLCEMVAAFDAEMLVVDGASDTFDGDELKRAQVRSFMRLLVRTHPERRMTVLLLGHVNKVTAGTRRTQNDDDGYSGSTAWHNSARGRLFLDVIDKGQPVLKHRKNQEGALEADQHLVRLDASGVFVTPVQFTGAFGKPAAAAPAEAPAVDHTGLLLMLLHHYVCGTSDVSTAGNSPKSAYNTFKAHPRFPVEWKDDAKAGRAAVQEAMELAEADGKVERNLYEDEYRNTRTRWRLTEHGAALLEGGLR
ncbi:MAG: AAA family ATPase [Burkholderiaceae bacterium]